MEAFAMKPNVGVVDRSIRLGLAAVLLYVGLVIYGSSALGFGLVAVGAILLATGLVGFCGIYSLLGLRTNKTPEAQ